MKLRYDPHLAATSAKVRFEPELTDHQRQNINAFLDAPTAIYFVVAHFGSLCSV
jgi:hypothetical protein